MLDSREKVIDWIKASARKAINEQAKDEYKTTGGIVKRKTHKTKACELFLMNSYLELLADIEGFSSTYWYKKLKEEE